MKRSKVSKAPWGTIAGVFGIFCFYLSIAVFGVYFIFAEINGQTGQEATLFDTWWQTALFIAAVVSAVLFVFFLMLFVKKKVNNKKVSKENRGGRRLR